MQSSASRPPKAGDPSQGPRYAPFCDILDILPCLEGQTTFKFDETRTITSGAERWWKWRKKWVDTMKALQEKPQKPKKTGRNGEPTRQNDIPGAPTRGLGHERSANGGPPLKKHAEFG